MTNRRAVKTISRIIAINTFLLALIVSSAFSDLTSALFTSEKELAGKTLQLRGIGLKKVFLFKAFTAGFYFEEGIRLEDPLADVAKRIEVHYFVDIPAKKLSQFTIDSMLDNITKEDFRKMTKEVDLMRKYFVDLKPGDVYSLTYIPGVGTKFIYNDRLVGTISGKDFAKALFSTWVGQKPFDQNLKEQILGPEHLSAIN